MIFNSFVQCLIRAWSWTHLHACNKSSSTVLRPDVCKGVRARSLLLAALSRAWAPNGACNWGNFSLLLLFFQKKHILEGLNMLENIRNFAHLSEVVKNLIFYGFWGWAWQYGSIVPATKFQIWCPSFHFHVDEQNLVCTCQHNIISIFAEMLPFPGIVF